VEKLADFFSTLGEKWQSWAAIIFICIGLEAGAVFFQEVLMYYPCELCIYTRVWMSAMVLVALLALAFRKKLWPMRFFVAVELCLAVGLAAVVWELLAIEYGLNTNGACNLVANFPSWARLDEWLPTLFLVQDSCGKTPLVLGPLSMADGLAGISVGFIAVLSLTLSYSFKRK
jgi:Disulfide bond formation protein DsbB